MGAGAVELTYLRGWLVNESRVPAELVGARFPGQGETVAAVA